jgi:hypothetical protein
MTERPDEPATVADIVASLREELLAEPLDQDVEAIDTQDDQRAAALVAAATTEPLVRSAVRSLLTDDSPLLTADRRERLIAAVDRALEPLAERTLPLPLLMRTCRLRGHMPIDQLAATAGLPVENLTNLERGGADVGKQSEQAVANWIVAVGVDCDLALAALERTLEWEQRPDRELAAGRPVHSVDTAAFVEKVRNLLPGTGEGER